MDKPKVLYFDIETTPLITANFRLGKQHIGHDQILKRPQVMVICWAWGDSKVQGKIFDLSKYDWYAKDDDADYKLIKDFITVAAQADLIIGHNAKKFDVAVLKSRIIKHKLPVLAPVLVDDTWEMTKNIAFTSHKLDDLGDYLNLGRKKPHGNGYEWWIDIIRGSTKTLNNMMGYCKVDVERLRAIYKTIKPYTKSAVNMSIFTGKPLTCRSCGSGKVNKRGYAGTTAGLRQRYQCTECGAWSTEGTNLIKKPGTYLR